MILLEDQTLGVQVVSEHGPTGATHARRVQLLTQLAAGVKSTEEALLALTESLVEDSLHMHLVDAVFQVWLADLSLQVCEECCAEDGNADPAIYRSQRQNANC